MPDAITQAYVQQYKANVELLLQQQTSRLRRAVTTDSYVGKAASVVEQFGAAEAQKVVGRHQTTPIIDVPQAKRWVFPTDYVWASPIDRPDRLRMLIDPASAYVKAGAAAMARAHDAEIMAAFFGTAKVGENGTTDEAFDTTNYKVALATGGNNSLNVGKLRDALKKLMKAHKGEINEPVYAAITTDDHDALLAEVQVTSKDFNSAMVMEEGRVRRYMGIEFIIIESVPTSGSSRLLPVWVPSGMHLGIWEDVMARVDERSDMNYAMQVFLRTTVGATRLQQGKVIQIEVQ